MPTVPLSVPFLAPDHAPTGVTTLWAGMVLGPSFHTHQRVLVTLLMLAQVSPVGKCLSLTQTCPLVSIYPYATSSQVFPTCPRTQLPDPWKLQKSLLTCETCHQWELQHVPGNLQPPPPAALWNMTCLVAGMACPSPAVPTFCHINYAAVHSTRIFPCGHKCQGWTRLTPGAGSFSNIRDVGGRNPGMWPSSAAFPVPLLGSLLRSEVLGTWTGAHMQCQHVW